MTGAPDRPRGRRIAVVATAVALAALGAALLWRMRPGPPPPAVSAEETSPAAGPEPFTFRWPEGAAYAYRLAFASSGTFALGSAGSGTRQAPITAAVALEGELALRSYGRLGPDGAYVLGVQLTRIDRATWTLGDRPVTPEGSDALTARELALVVAPDGRFESLNLSPDDPPLLANLLRQVLGGLQISVAPGRRTWEGWETNPVGQVLVAYTLRADEPGRLVVLRRPARYTALAAGPLLADARIELAGSSEAVLDRAGHLADLDGSERVLAQRAGGEAALRHETRLAVHLVGITRIAPGPGPVQRLAGLTATGLGDSTAPPDTGRKLLEQRIAGLGMEALLRDLRVHGGADEFPDAGRWMWRATGLLLLHPERCRELAPLFVAPGTDRRTRARILDLLAATGSAEAQTVLRALLETRAARGSDEPGLLVQRLSLVEQPTSETVDYLRTRVERAHGEGALSAAHALGATLGKRARTGELDARAAALLRERLSQARTAGEKAGWVSALGAAGLKEDVPLLARLTGDTDVGVRTAAVLALRSTQTPESEATLLALAADPDGTVRERALHTLASYTLGPAHLATLGDAVRSGRLPPRDFAMLATVLERHRQQRAAVLPVVEAMLATPLADARLALRLRSLRELVVR